MAFQVENIVQPETHHCEIVGEYGDLHQVLSHAVIGSKSRTEMT